MRLRTGPGLAPALALAAALAAGACADEQGGDAEAFCADIEANREVILTPRLTDEAAVTAYLDIYRNLADEAPLAIEEHWDALVLAYETMSTVEAGDAESEQRALARMYATQRSAIAVHDWVLDSCGIDMGPVATVGPPTTTIPGSTPPTTER